MAAPALPLGFIAWRHPRAIGHAGRCIGRTDLGIDPRKARRLARRIHRHALKQGLPKLVCTSSLKRCRAVGHHLRSLGWRHVVDDALLEADFGNWDGQAWAHIARSDVDAWVADFLDHAPAGGEPLRALLARASTWQRGTLVVSHGGWILARRWMQERGQDLPCAADWPAPPRYGAGWRL